MIRFSIVFCLAVKSSLTCIRMKPPGDFEGIDPIPTKKPPTVVMPVLTTPLTPPTTTPAPGPCDNCKKLPVIGVFSSNNGCEDSLPGPVPTATPVVMGSECVLQYSDCPRYQFSRQSVPCTSRTPMITTVCKNGIFVAPDNQEILSFNCIYE